MLLVPAGLLAATVLARDPLGEALGIEPHPHGPGFSFAAFFPHWLLVGFFTLFAGLSGIVAAAGLVRFWRALEAASPAGPGAPGVLAVLPRVLKTILSHERFSKCAARGGRRTTHVLVLYGFLALFGTTVWAVIDLYLVPMFGGKAGYPYGLLHPVKVLAIAGAILLVAGSAKAILDRLGPNAATEATTAFDVNFAGLLLAVGLTGIVLEVMRFASGEAPGEGFLRAAHGTYLVHLALVFGLLVYLPYSKFAHAVYRTVAMLHAERAGAAGGCSPGAAAVVNVAAAEGPRGKGDVR
jgi:quinone-modifying oxidoreductase subunit QmoC